MTATTLGKAVLLEVRPRDFNGDARVYDLDPPISWRDREAETQHVARYVIVSAADALSGPETYIFPAEPANGSFEVADWCELPGSFRGYFDHDEALRGAGYAVVR